MFSNQLEQGITSHDILQVLHKCGWIIVDVYGFTGVSTLLCSIKEGLSICTVLSAALAHIEIFRFWNNFQGNTLSKSHIYDQSGALKVGFGVLGFGRGCSALCCLNHLEQHHLSK